MDPARRAFLTLFVVDDPVGIAPVFLGLAGSRSAGEQARVARNAVVVASVVLFGFALGGAWLLEKLGISMDAFQIAGGILLFRIAVGMVLAAVFAMAAAVLALTWLALRLASPLGRVLRRTGVNVVTRVFGVLLAALAVQYVADGVRGLVAAG